ncbi:hypothetical protein [Roseiflexus sp.]|nr:hypothetical protein [Roseiflexus sp.]
MSRLPLFSRSALHRRDHQRWPDLSGTTAYLWHRSSEESAVSG